MWVGGKIHVGLFLRPPPGLRLCLGVAMLLLLFFFWLFSQLLLALRDATCAEVRTGWMGGWGVRHREREGGFGAAPGADGVPGGEIQPWLEGSVCSVRTTRHGRGRGWGNTAQKVHGSVDGVLFYQEGEMQFCCEKKKIKISGIFSWGRKH